MYIYHTYKNNEYYLFGSLPTLSEKTGVSLGTLKSKFNREKTKVKDGIWHNEKEEFKIIKVEITKR